MSKRSSGGNTAAVAEAALQPSASLSVGAKEKALLLKAVADKHGILTAEFVVQEANPANAKGVAHRLAECVGWSKPDSEAAHRWRLDQARMTIRAATPLEAGGLAPVTFPLSGDNALEIRLRSKISKAEFERLKAVLISLLELSVVEGD